MREAGWLEVAEAAARGAGDHALSRRGGVKAVAGRTAHDIKLVLDRECQDRAEGVIREAFPEAVFLGEEGGVGTTAKDEPEWIIDPLDGTVNYFRGVPWWCSAVAVRVNGRMEAGAIYAPELGRMYGAERGKGATCNGVRIEVSQVDALKDAFLMTGMSKSGEDVNRGARMVERFKERVLKIRLMGAAALDLCMVADGSADIFCETGIYIWDVGAGMLLIEEAGGRAEILKAFPDGRLTCFAASPGVYEVARALAEGESK
ncbi:MAG TPA: inositol monophosphatase family protein [Kiritimatiellia bacterium]|nr:inositol monophosphatase family protein [Kiritimatiellia bacterium]